MKRLYHKVKAHFLELEKDFGKEEEILLRNAKYFFVFCMAVMVFTLIYYSQTHEEFLPLIVLSATAIMFWTHSDQTGRIFMIAAASIGFLHEVIGGMEGWFAYPVGVVFQTPLWLIPGYAAIYWSCYNLWKRGRRKYHIKEGNFKLLAVSIIALMFALDLVNSSFRPNFWLFDIAIIGIVILLFKIPAERHLALVTWFLITFEEVIGHSLRVWQHYAIPGQVSTLAGYVDLSGPAAINFSFVGLLPSYLLFLWISLRFADFVRNRSLPTKRELALVGLALGLKAYTWLTTSRIFGIVI
jgi:hypothetical protein